MLVKTIKIMIIQNNLTLSVRLKQIKFLLFIPLLFGLINSAYSQTSLHNKKGKLKTIVYVHNDYAATGHVYKKQFVCGQKLTFIANPYGLKDTIVSGRYYCTDDGTSYIAGIWKVNSRSYDFIITKGTFKVSNKRNGIGVTANKKEGQKLRIAIEDLSYYKSLDYDNRADYYDTIILQKLPDNKYSLKIRYKDLTLEETIPFKLNQKINFYNFDNYIKKSRQVKLSFKNGDVFIGKIKSASYFLASSDYYYADYAPDSGEYIYKTGEISKGIFEYNNYFNRFYLEEGVTVFADGSKGKGDWLFQPDLTTSEQERIYRNGKSPTEMRNMAKRIIEEKEKKLHEKELAEKKAEQARLQKQKVREKKLVVKYGEYYGNKILKGDLVPGMSQAMVNEIWNKNFFRISTIVRDNKTIVIWKFDKEKMQMEIMKEGSKNKENEDGALALILAMNFSEKMGGLDIPQILIFTNNRLTDIYK